MMRTFLLAASLATAFAAVSCSGDGKWTEIPGRQYNLVVQKRGATLGYSPSSGVTLLFRDGYAFKDLNRNGELDPYEDWRLPMEERAENLASMLTADEIAGLMLYSEHQAVPTDSEGYWSSTYNGVSLAESGLPHSALSDKQKNFLENDNLRAVLVVRVESPRNPA